jgi:hypothetical protein
MKVTLPGGEFTEQQRPLIQCLWSGLQMTGRQAPPSFSLLFDFMLIGFAVLLRCCLFRKDAWHSANVLAAYISKPLAPTLVTIITFISNTSIDIIISISNSSSTRDFYL